MKNLLLIFALALSYVSFGQTVPMTNNVPWYEFSKKLSVGKFMLKSAGEYDTSFTIPANTASITLDTIAADKTVTFTDGSAYDKGVVMYVQNSNNSAFVWNVSGNVKEADGTVISNLPRGLHIFYWNSNAWIRLSTSGGSSPTVDTLTFTSPLVQLDKNVSLDFDAFPQDTVGVVNHNDSLFNILYSHTGTRDSTFIVKLTAGGGGRNIYNMDSTLAADRIIAGGGHTLTLTGTTSSTQFSVVNGDGQAGDFSSLNGYGLAAGSSASTGLYAASTTGQAIEGTIVPTAANTVVPVMSLYRKHASPTAGIGASLDLYNSTSTTFNGAISNSLQSSWTTSTHASRTSKFVITGVNSGTTTDWFTLIPSYGLLGTDTIATRAYARSVATGGTPAGSNKQIQYNNSGSFGGEALFEYDPSTNVLTADTGYFQRLKAQWDLLGFDGTKDTTLSFDRITHQLVKTIGAGDNAFDGDRKIKVFAGIIRPDITAAIGQPIVWDWLYPASDHDTIGFSAPIAVVGSGMTIYYRTMESVLYFSPTEDDEFKKNRVAIGASVGTDNANLSFTTQTKVGGYLRGNGTTWVVNGPLNSGIDWSYSSGQFNWAYKTGITTADIESVSANYEGSNGYTTKRVLSGIPGPYTAAFAITDQFGNTAGITPQTTDVIAMQTGGSFNNQISIQNRHATITDPYITTGSAIFVLGIFQDLASPNRLYGPITTSNITTTQIQLDWPAATGGAGNYVVKRSTTKNFSSTTTIYTGTALTYTDTGLTTGTTYYYQVQHTQTSGTVKSDMLFKSQATL